MHSTLKTFNFSLYNYPTVWTQLAYLFNWRTAKRLAASPPPR